MQVWGGGEGLPIITSELLRGDECREAFVEREGGRPQADALRQPSAPALVAWWARRNLQRHVERQVPRQRHLSQGISDIENG